MESAISAESQWTKDFHADHIFPRSAGGPDTIDNLAISHKRCNLKKGWRIYPVQLALFGEKGIAAIPKK